MVWTWHSPRNRCATQNSGLAERRRSRPTPNYGTQGPYFERLTHWSATHRHAGWPKQRGRQRNSDDAHVQFKNLWLVPRTRSSHSRAASPIANFGFKRGTRIIELLVSL